MKKFPYYKQYDAMDCGPTCLRMVSKHYGRPYSMDTLRQKSGINREGVSLLGISEAAGEIGFRTVAPRWPGADRGWIIMKRRTTDKSLERGLF